MTVPASRPGTRGAAEDPGPSGPRLRVLQSLRAVTGSTNPYLSQLITATGRADDVSLFSWPRAFGGGYDVLHLHWPERLVRGRSPIRDLARQLLFVALLVSTRLRRQAIVRTLHNEAPHEPGSRLESLVLRLADRRTSLWILLNDRSHPPTSAPSVVIPHGDYRPWLSDLGVTPPPSEPGRMLFFGLVRRYKGIEELLAAFTGLDEPGVTLRLTGQTVDAGTADVIRAAQADERITARLEHVPDTELVDEIGRSQLVVLPYRGMTNSGAALLALSLRRPILVPDNPVTRLLAAEVGEQWVHRFVPDLSGACLRAALELTATPPTDPPDLGRRDWTRAGADHAAAYRRAVALVKG